MKIRMMAAALGVMVSPVAMQNQEKNVATRESRWLYRFGVR